MSRLSTWISIVFFCLGAQTFAFNTQNTQEELPQRESPPPFLWSQSRELGLMGVPSGTDPWAVGQNFKVHTLDASFKTIGVRVWPIMSVPSSSDPYKVTVDLNRVALRNSQGLRVIDPVSGQVLATGNEVILRVDKNRIEVGGQRIKLQDLDVQVLTQASQTIPSLTTMIWESGKSQNSYRGSFRIRQTLHQVVDRWTQVVTYSGMHWSMINDVDLEDYLLAVVPSEMPASFGIEALKAQAVAARTYAVFHQWQARKIFGRVWDVDPTTWFQSYRGASVEHSNITPAVVATRGLILTSEDRVIEAFFSSNSGGVTCRISECFWLPDRPYAITQKDIEGVREMPGGKWTANATPKGAWDRLVKLQSEGRLSIAQLAPHIRGPQDISGIEAGRWGESGRTWQLQIIPRNGPRVLLNEEFTREMRWQFGFKTSFYEIASPTKLPGQFVQGYGLGHGVGMSQWGAEVMARKGWGFSEVLAFYYSGSALFQLL